MYQYIFVNCATNVYKGVCESEMLPAIVYPLYKPSFTYKSFPLELTTYIQITM